MNLRTRTSSPLRPLAQHAFRLSSACDELWIATAFVSDKALGDVVHSAITSKNKARVRFLTGTFGNVTRLSTFKRLWRFSQTHELEARIWRGDFHAKLALWRRGSGAHCWIGSANITDGGLQNEGEIVAEISGRWDSPQFVALRDAFDAEWSRGDALDQKFLRAYREAPRVRKLLNGQVVARPRARPPTRGPAGGRASRLKILPVTYHYPEGSAAAARISARLGGTDTWYRSSGDALRHVQRGQHCLLADGLDRTLELVVVTDKARDGKGYVLAHAPFVRGGTRKVTRALRARLLAIGLTPTSKTFRSRRLDKQAAGDIVEAIYSRGTRLRFDSQA